MRLATVYSRGSVGIDAPLVTVEAHLSPGVPRFNIVGLPEAVVKESKDRVRSAIINSHYEFPMGRITVNLAPGELPKESVRFDLPIALGILAASGQIPRQDLDAYEFAGELSLSGELRPFTGALPFSIGTRSAKRTLIISADNAEEAALPGKLKIYAVNRLSDVCAFFHNRMDLTEVESSGALEKAVTPNKTFDMSDVKGQKLARRALEIAAAGNHSLLMMGPPGTGKTMLAQRLASILPELETDKALEVMAVASLVNKSLKQTVWRQPPFRAPHHTASSVAMVGGGSNPRPGEISLAHNGVLFLDELPEFDRKVLEVLREPLESGNITISRAARQAVFPAKFQLIAAMNPCPCGYLGDKLRACKCTPAQIQRYQSKLSGPLLDRIDMHLEVAPLPKGILKPEQNSTNESSAKIRPRVIAARKLQLKRQQKTNNQLNAQELGAHCQLSSADADFLEDSLEKLKLSARSYHRILRVARTIADLAASEHILKTHLLEALSYRKLDREF